MDSNYKVAMDAVRLRHREFIPFSGSISEAVDKWLDTGLLSEEEYKLLENYIDRHNLQFIADQLQARDEAL